MSLRSLSQRVTLRSAAIVFTAGWSFFWGAALHVTDVVPLWLPLLVMIAGLLMIPLAVRRAGHVAKLTFPQQPAAASSAAAAEIE